MQNKNGRGHSGEAELGREKAMPARESRHIISMLFAGKREKARCCPERRVSHPQEIYERLCTEYLKKSLPRLRELAPAARAPPTERIKLLDTRNSMEMLSLVLQLFRQRHQDGLRILVDGTSRLRVF